MTTKFNGQAADSPAETTREITSTMTCDRCNETFEAQYTLLDGEMFSTRGFLMTDTPFWASLVDTGEDILCAACIETDDRLRPFVFGSKHGRE